MKTKFCILVLELIMVVGAVRYVSAQTWTPTSAPSLPWSSLACSADGNQLVAAGFFRFQNEVWFYRPLFIYTSADSGATWTQSATTSNLWTSVAISADGTKLVAAAKLGFDLYNGDVAGDGGVYASTNSGVTWTRTTAPANNWSSVTSSADGTKLVAVSLDDGAGDDEGSIYISLDSGVTWARTSAPANGWSLVASSADGTKIVAADTWDGRVYISTNSGADWVQSGAPESFYWTSIASSADGMKLIAAQGLLGGYGGAPGTIYTSANGGITWMPTAAPTNDWISVASSADGTRFVAGTSGYDFGDQPIYTSTDSGATWQLSGPQTRWSSVTISADGAKSFATEGGEGIANYGLVYAKTADNLLPKLSIHTSNASLGISWLVSSSSFMLQQNSDLTTTNWTDVPIAPSLIFTNLNYQVTLSPTNGQGFYRLR